MSLARILRHMCNLHIKETEISVILSVLSNKTNLILGFRSPLMFCEDLFSTNATDKC